MNCLECEQAGALRAAVALRHYCPAAICPEHAKLVPKHLEMLVSLGKPAPPPVPAQVSLWGRCHAAITQARLNTAACGLAGKRLNEMTISPCKALRWGFNPQA